MSSQTLLGIVGALPLLVSGGCGDDGQLAEASTSTASTGTPAQTDTTGPMGATSSTTGADDSTGDDGTSSTSGATDTSGDDTTSGGLSACPRDHLCFDLPGTFFTATARDPVGVWQIDLPAGAEYRVVDVELDVGHGGWFEDDPAGLHNIFWLHRGSFDDFTWLGGVVGYVNLRGPNTDIVRTRHDLDVLDLADSKTFNIGGVAPDEGHSYRVHYRYDTEANEVLVQMYSGDDLIGEGTDVPTTDLVRNTDGGMFIAFGNPTDVGLPGPEVPSLGWSWGNLRVEFTP